MHDPSKKIYLTEVSSQLEEYEISEVAAALELLAKKEILHKFEKGVFFMRDHLFHRYLEIYYSNRPKKKPKGS